MVPSDRKRQRAFSGTGQSSQKMADIKQQSPKQQKDLEEKVEEKQQSSQKLAATKELSAEQQMDVEKQKEEREKAKAESIQQQLKIADEEVQERINFAGQKFKARAESERALEYAVVLRRRLKDEFEQLTRRAKSLRDNAYADPQNALKAYRSCKIINFINKTKQAKFIKSLRTPSLLSKTRR